MYHLYLPKSISYLDKLRIEPLDERLRYIRETALFLFESARTQFNKKGLSINEDELEGLYLHCMARLCQLQGIEIPKGILPLNEKFENLMKEI